MNDDVRKYMAAVGVKFLGTPYIYGGSNPHVGFDCSGFVIWISQPFDVLPSGDWGSATLSTLFQRYKTPEQGKPGDFAFYGKDESHVSHVMMCIGKLNGIPMVVGASGGDSTTTTEEEARKRNAMVKIKPMNYRRDLLFAVNIEQPLF